MLAKMCSMGTQPYCWQSSELEQTLWTSMWWFLRKLLVDLYLLYTLSHICKGFPILPQGHLLNYIHNSFIQSRKKWLSAEECIKKMWHIYTTEYDSTVKEICRQIDRIGKKKSSELGHPDPEIQSWYAVTHRWLFGVNNQSPILSPLVARKQGRSKGYMDIPGKGK